MNITLWIQFVFSSGEKIGLGKISFLKMINFEILIYIWPSKEIITLLSIIMFLQFFMGIVPESSFSVPKIAIYFASVMIISAMSILSNILVIIF